MALNTNFEGMCQVKDNCLNVFQGKIPVWTFKCNISIDEEYSVIAISLKRLAYAVNCVLYTAFSAET